MAAQPLRGFRWIYNVHGGQQVLMELPVKISQTIYRGNLLNISATSGSVRVGAAADTTIAYVAMQAKATTATQKTATMQVTPLAFNAVFEVVGAKATMTTQADGAAYRNSLCDVRIDTTGYHRVDTAASTNVLRIVGWPNSTSDATGAGRKWHVMITPTASQFHHVGDA